MWKPVNEKYAERERLNKIGYEVRGAIFEVYNALGPGLLEVIYEEAVMMELQQRGLKVVNQVSLTVYYKDAPLKHKQRIDLLVEDEVIVELKSVEELHTKHFKQVVSQLKSSGKRLAYLVNFNCEFMKDGKDLARIVNNL